MKRIWPFSVTLLYFAGIAFMAPFLVLYYQELGFSGIQIGFLTGITPLITFICAPLWTRLADGTRKHRLIMSVTFLVGGISILLFPFIRQFLPLFFMAVFFNAFFAPVTSFIDSATMFMLGDKKEMYGRVRLGGTVGFGISTPIAGIVVQNYGLAPAFWVSGALFLLGVVISQKLVYGEPMEVIQIEGGIVSLLKSSRWQIFMAMAFAGGIAATAVNLYFFPYMSELGASESTMGLGLTIGILAEIPILFFGDRLIKRFKSYGLLLMAMVFSGIRVLLFGLTGNYMTALSIQVINGLTFPAMWMAGVSYANEIAPEGLKTTAQGLFGAMVFGIGSAAGGFICGPLLGSVGGQGLFLIVGVIVLSIVGVSALFQRRITVIQI